jgi:hypothetical protein
MTPKNMVLSTAAFLIGAALFIGTPVYAAEKSTLSDPTIAALWAQIEVLQKQIAELQKAQKTAVVAPVFGAAIATSTASSETSTSTEAKLKKHNECMKKREAQKYKKISCFYEW